MDILRPFPLACGNRKFIIFAIDYFTIWVETDALATITINKVISFLRKFIISRFDIPRVLITDNSIQFDNKRFKDLYLELQIIHRFSLVSHSQTNRQAELTNGEILKGLKKKLEKAKEA